MREINRVVVHCLDSDNKKHGLKALYRWHVIERGWKGIGYHIFIDHDARRHYCKPINRMGSHAKGFNRGSIGICIAGKKKFSKKQLDVLVSDLKHYMLIFDLKKHQVVGHYELNKNKTCPNIPMDAIRERL